MFEPIEKRPVKDDNAAHLTSEKLLHEAGTWSAPLAGQKPHPWHPQPVERREVKAGGSGHLKLESPPQKSGAWSEPVTGYEGRTRRPQPPEGSFPTLLPERGHDRGSEGKYQTDEQLSKYMTPEAHKAALETLVHTAVYEKTSEDLVEVRGSGTIIGHGTDVTYVATVDHTTSDYYDDKSNKYHGRPLKREEPITVKMPDGRTFDARRTFLHNERGTDRSVLLVHTGDATGTYKEAQIADAPLKGHGFAIGFPHLSKSPYLSTLIGHGDETPTLAERKHGARKYMTENRGHSEEGMSGGGMYTRDGKLFSMDEGSDGTLKVFEGVPIRQKDVERWKTELPMHW